MTDRTIIASMEQMRDFDFVQDSHDTLLGLGGLAQDVMSGLPVTVVSGLAAAPTAPASLTINIGSGRIYQIAAADATGAGSIVQDPTLIVQQGLSLGQAVTLVAPSVGQSQWSLIQAQFSQVDAVRANDPTGGIVPFYNASNTAVPNPVAVNTVRQAKCIIQVISGAAAVTGSETPPQPTNGWVPLYLVDLVGGQTTISGGQILTAAPSIGTGVGAGYPYAPFLAGLLSSHHSGNAGQAPKIKLGSEVQGILPYANMSSVRQLLGASLTLYVSASTGSDSNNGLAPTSPFLTIQAAVNAGYRNYDFNGNQFTISVANGTYAVAGGGGAFAVTFNGLPLGCPQVNLVGNVGSPGSVTLAVTNGNGITSTLGAAVSVSGMTITASGTNAGILTTRGYGVYASYGGLLILSTCVIGSCGSLQCGVGEGYLILNGPLTLTGTTPISFSSSLGGLIWLSGQTITSSGLTVSVSFVNAAGGALIIATGNTFVGTPTGVRFIAQLLGMILTSGGGANYFPGTVAGTGTSPGVAPFGLYA